MQWGPLALPDFEALAEALGALLEGGEVLLLRGGLGAGKTTFVRAMARRMGLSNPGRVSSPTFTVCAVHRGRVPLVHVDLYRLGEAGPMGAESAAFEAFDLPSVLEDAEAAEGGHAPVVAVEWPEYLSRPPPDHLAVRLAVAGVDLRTVTAGAHGTVSAGLLSRWERAFPER